MPRPSLVTSSGPSPVRGFIAAILLPFPALGPHRTATAGTTRRTAPGGTPASHMHLDQSLYYPVFGRPMVTISVPALSSPILGENRTPGAYPRPVARGHSARFGTWPPAGPRPGPQLPAGRPLGHAQCDDRRPRALDRRAHEWKEATWPIACFTTSTARSRRSRSTGLKRGTH